MNLRDTYNRIAEAWHKDHKTDDWWVGGTEKFISLLDKGNSVLDVGCGAGVKSKYLKERGLDVVGMDFSDKLIEIAKRENPDIEFLVMDMYEAESLNKKFDGIFAQASLLHIKKNDTPKVIKGLSSLLNSGGYFYVAVKGVRADGLEEGVLKENDYGYEYERYFSYYKLDELEKYFTDIGLRVVYKDSHISGKTEWLQIIGRKN